MELSRRHLFGMAAGAAAVASLPVPVLAAEPVAVTYTGNTILPLSMITKEAVRMFKANNPFMRNLAQYDECFS